MITQVLALRHNALKPHLAGMKEDSGTVLCEVLIQTQTGGCSRKQTH